MYEELIFYFVIGAIIFVMIYYDAKYRAFKQYPILWALMGLILPPLIILYYLNRKPKIKD